MIVPAGLWSLLLLDVPVPRLGLGSSLDSLEALLHKVH